MNLDRRTFLQQAGWFTAILGLSQTNALGVNKQDWLTSVNRYLQSLAEPTTRKLALLVGINEYPDNQNLFGCITDVELQRELLIYRFGFQPQDIITLTGKQATRENIENAFLEHLIQQAAPTDVVVFHYSGYGSQIAKPDSYQSQVVARAAAPQLNSLIPADGIVRTKGNPTVNYLLEDTLILLGRSLATDKFTLVLDTSHHSNSQLLQGNFRSRSFIQPANASLSPEELAFQEKLKLRQSLKKINKVSSLPGIILQAASPNQIAVEAPWNGFYAGLFTYGITQYLWEVTPASKITVSLRRTAEQVERLMGFQQQPQSIGNINKPLFTYYLLPESTIGAEGVIKSIGENDIEIQLGGLPPLVLLYYEVNSCFTVVDSQDIYLQLRSLEGLTAKARISKPVKGSGLKNLPKDKDESLPALRSLEVGQLVQEVVRIVTRNMGLVVALDKNLDRIERVDATSAFSSLDVVTTVVNAQEAAADCLLASSSGGYGLFSVGGVAIPHTMGTATEAVKSAVQRFTPNLKSLLAVKLWHLTVNEGSSLLPVTVSLELVGEANQSIITKQTNRIATKKSNQVVSLNTDKSIATLPRGSLIQYRLENNSTGDIYLMMLGMDSSGKAFGVYSSKSLGVGETAIMPEPSKSVNWIVSGSVGLTTMYVFCTQAPLPKTAAMFGKIPSFSTDKEEVVDLPFPLEISRVLWQDLDNISGIDRELIGSSGDIYALDLHAWATFSFIYEVI